MKQLENIHSITVRGRRYKFLLLPNLINETKNRGRTDNPEAKGKTVVVDPDQSPKEMLATLLDELIHCAVWELDNDIVDEISDDIAHVLWRCGLRFVDNPEEVD